MRYLLNSVRRDLSRKMVFVGGPRQVGKTTLCQSLLSSQGAGRYFNYDYDEDRIALLDKRWSQQDTLLVFDELHKFSGWKSWLKGNYDVLKNKHRFLVTGSARLDVYREGGDSMLGRYHHWRLHPFSLDELPEGLEPTKALARLLTVGGFPEPLLADDEREARRWRNARFDRILQEDIRDLESIKEIQKLRLFLDLLRQRVGGMVVLSNLANDVQVSAPSAKRWLEALERMYLLFTVQPYTLANARALQKPPKVYFFDNADVIETGGARLENLVASHLLKRLNYIEDEHGYRCELKYLRDKEGREVDFLLLVDGEPLQLIEVKAADPRPSTSLRYYWQRMKPIHPRLQAVQLVGELEHPFETPDGIRVTSIFDYFTQEIPWQTRATEGAPSTGVPRKM